MSDLQYGFERENINHERLERFLGCKLKKLGKYDTMDWVEEQEDDDETTPWYVEQKARRMTYATLRDNYKSPVNEYPSALIGKNKIEFMKHHGNGIVVFDFTDRLMFWQYNDEQYEKMEIEEKFLRGARLGFIDKPNPVVHIPCSLLRDVPRPK